MMIMILMIKNYKYNIKRNYNRIIIKNKEFNKKEYDNR